METVTEFFISDTGQILSKILLVLGLFDILITRVPFLPLAKEFKKAQEALFTTADPDQKQKLQHRLNGLNTIRIMTSIFGVVMIAIGIFGLTR